jgi:small-conductance mechanosensitive channel
VHLLGVDAGTARKVLFTAALVAGLLLLRWVARRLVGLAWAGRAHTRSRFWARQGINLAMLVVLLLGTVSIWFDNGVHAAAGIGLLSAAVVFAMQRVVTAIAGYFLILRGDVFSIGDRIVMGGVRGDVIALGFLRTTILEMGQPPGDDDVTVPTWVEGRQYTGRIVTVTNGVVFDEPVFNYSRDFPFLWEEMRVPVPYDTDRAAAEQILLEAARRHSHRRVDTGTQAVTQMRRRYFVPSDDVNLEPEVYYKLTDNWLELAVRFVVPTHDIRRVKSDIARDVLAAFEERGITVASGTYAIVQVPPLRFAADEAPPAPYPDGDGTAGPKRRASASGAAARPRRARGAARG